MDIGRIEKHYLILQFDYITNLDKEGFNLLGAWYVMIRNDKNQNDYKYVSNNLEFPLFQILPKNH